MIGKVIEMHLLLSVAFKITAVGKMLPHHTSANMLLSASYKGITKKVKKAFQNLYIKVLDILLIIPPQQYFAFTESACKKKTNKVTL
jgi:hypothetical protein